MNTTQTISAYFNSKQDTTFYEYIMKNFCRTRLLNKIKEYTFHDSTLPSEYVEYILTQDNDKEAIEKIITIYCYEKMLYTNSELDDLQDDSEDEVSEDEDSETEVSENEDSEAEVSENDADVISENEVSEDEVSEDEVSEDYDSKIVNTDNLHWLLNKVCKYGYTDTAKYLLDNYTEEILCGDRTWYNAMFFATKFGYFEIVKLLVDINDNDNNETYGTVFYTAIINKHYEIANYILNLKKSCVNHVGYETISGITDLDLRTKILIFKQKFDENDIETLNHNNDKIRQEVKEYTSTFSIFLIIFGLFVILYSYESLIIETTITNNTVKMMNNFFDNINMRTGNNLNDLIVNEVIVKFKTEFTLFAEKNNYSYFTLFCKYFNCDYFNMTRILS